MTFDTPPDTPTRALPAPPDRTDRRDLHDILALVLAGLAGPGLGLSRLLDRMEAER